MINKSHKKAYNFFFLALIILVSLASFFWAFYFYFTSEDWWELWVISNPKLNYLIFQTDLFANHPIGTYMQILMVHFFGYNSYLWQISGYTFKVLNSLAVVLMVWGMTNSKRAAFYSGLIFAASVGGLESYVWLAGRTSALILLPMTIGFYFWVRSFPGKILNKKYIIACFVFLLAIFGAPGRGSIIFALCLIWDIVTTQKYSKKSISKIILRNGLFISICLSLLLIFWKNHIFNNSSNNYLYYTNYLILHPLETGRNFLISIGNFIGGGFVLTYDAAHLNVSEKLALTSSIIFLIVTFIFLIRSLTKKDLFFRQMLFFLLWIPIAFFPNWFMVHFFTEPPLVAGVAHRYFTISAVGFTAGLGYLLTKLNKSMAVIILLCIILTNIAQSNRFLQQEWNYRSVPVVKPIWDRIEREIPQGETNDIILFLGSNALASELDSADAIPFAIKRNITNPAEVPIQTIVGEESLERLLCEDGVSYTTAVREQAISKKRIPLSHLYVWEAENGIVTNVSDRERKRLSIKLKCNYEL